MPVMTKKKKTGHGHKGKQAPFRTKPELIEALTACAEAERRTRNVLIEILLEEGLRSRGFWPWPRPDDEGGPAGE